MKFLITVKSEPQQEGDERVTLDTYDGQQVLQIWEEINHYITPEQIAAVTGIVTYTCGEIYTIKTYPNIESDKSSPSTISLVPKTENFILTDEQKKALTEAEGILTQLFK